MEKLPISIGILSWKSGQTLIDTLLTYHNNRLFDMVDECFILFQEYSDEDYMIAKHFGLDCICLKKKYWYRNGSFEFIQICKKRIHLTFRA